VVDLLIRQLLMDPLDRNSVSMHKEPWHIILQRNKEEKHRVPKKTRSMRRTEESNMGEKE
jgi:hypothetical protein